MHELTRREREKIQRKAEIVAAARGLFLSKGVEHVSMNDVAASSQFTKRTLYQYFSCKEDLCFAVLLDGYQSMWRMGNQAAANAGTGFEKVAEAYRAFFQYALGNPGFLLLMASLPSIKDTASPAPMPHKDAFFQYNASMFGEMKELFSLGLEDGTLRQDLDVSALLFTSLFSVTGFLHMYCVAGRAFLEGTTLTEPQFLADSLQLLLDSLSAPQTK